MTNVNPDAGTVPTGMLAGDSQSARVLRGVLAGLAGGVVFGMMMTMMGMMGMVGALVGQPSAAVGWVLHLIFSAIIGAVFGAIVPSPTPQTVPLLGWGAGYGLLWWVLGPLLIMPMLLGMGPQLSVAGMTSPAALQSLLGHLIFGVVTAFAYGWLGRR